MSGKLQKFRALSWQERWILLQALALLPLFWAGLRCAGFSRLLAWAEHAPVAGKPARSDIAPDRIGALIGVAGAHLPFPSTCLTRSLLLTWLLGRRGVRGELRIGVRRGDGGIDSHAWVEFEGEPVNETRDVAGRFAVFDTPLRSGSRPFP